MARCAGPTRVRQFRSQSTARGRVAHLVACFGRDARAASRRSLAVRCGAVMKRIGNSRRTGDELIFRLFALLNSTGLNLTKQEIRNAEYHGAFKSLVYDLSFQCLDKWRSWRLFSDDAVSRMNEAEAVSEYLMAMVQGVAGKRQPAISKFYSDNDDDLPNGAVLRRRFENVIEEIDIHLGTLLPQSAFQRPALFYSLFSAIYSHMYGLASPLKKGPAKSLPVDVAARLKKASRRIRAKDLPGNVQDAVDKATGDKARRLERHKFLMKALALESAQ